MRKLCLTTAETEHEAQSMIVEENTEDALREQMATALKESEQRYQAIFENSKENYSCSRRWRIGP